MLHERSVPHNTKNEGADENRQHEDQKLFESIHLIFRFDKIGEHLLHTDIFF